MTTRQLEIHRIYSAGPARAAAIPAQKTSAVRRVSVVGAMSLAVAAAWVYVAWWPADRLISRNLMLAGLANMPLRGDALGFGQVFGEAPEDLADPAPPEGTDAVVPAGEEGGAFGGPADDDFEALGASGQRVMERLYADMWAWLIVTTLAALCLALSGGSAAAGLRVTDPTKRRRRILGATLVALIAAWIASRLWQGRGALMLPETVLEAAFVACGLGAAYLLVTALRARAAGLLAILLAAGLAVVTGWAWRDWYTESFELFESYPAAAPRIVAVVLMVVAALAGAAMFRRSVGLHRITVVLIAVAAVTTAAALKYAASSGGVHTHTLSGATYVFLVAAQASYAVVLVGALGLRAR